MSRQIQIRRGTSAQHDNFTGAIGEITMDITNKTLRVHDGVTPGGNEIVSLNKFYSNMTNCITNIPNDINLSFSGGVLTIKKDSKIYYPNGAGVFNNVVLSDDETFDASGAGSATVYVFRRNATGTSGYFCAVLENINSGTPDSGTNGVFYDTTNNRIDYYDNGTRYDRLFSFPVCKMTLSGGTITSINQIFNGFGFVGASVYVLPGVQALIPNGRNSDGTLKNTLLTKQSVNVLTPSSATFSQITNIALGNSLSYHTFTYDKEKNTNSATGFMNAGNITWTNGKITSFNPKTTFDAVDYNDTNFIANQAMPGSKINNLTLGASGTTYAAPADGYFIAVLTSSGGAWANIYINTGNKYYHAESGIASGNHINACVPVSKGDVLKISYGGISDAFSFRFIYANGSK